MTITRDQAQIITTLACAARPTGARQWKPDDVMAELAKLTGRSLGAVICAVTRCAMDRNVERPECISSPGSHWGDTMVATPFVPRTIDRADRCSVCSNPRTACQMLWAHDHEFQSAVVAAKVAATPDPERIAAIKATLENTSGPTARRTPADLADANPKLHANLERVRQMIPTPPLQEPEEPVVRESGQAAVVS